MLKNALIGFFLLSGLWAVVSDRLPGAYPPAKAAIKARQSKKAFELALWEEKLAKKILPGIHIEQVTRSRLAEALSNLEHTETPEHYKARVYAKAIIYTLPSLLLFLFSLPLGFTVSLTVFYLTYQGEYRKIFRETEKRRREIERELPQFAATIRQALNTTRDISSILKNYSEIAGQALKEEIQKTLNDIYTGNAEDAVQRLEKRIVSAEMSKLTRSLIAILRGDDQRSFLDTLTSEYRKSQDAAIERELLLRPKKLNPYLAAMFLSFSMMVAASMGQGIIQGLNTVF